MQRLGTTDRSLLANELHARMSVGNNLVQGLLGSRQSRFAVPNLDKSVVARKFQRGGMNRMGAADCIFLATDLDATMDVRKNDFNWLVRCKLENGNLLEIDLGYSVLLDFVLEWIDGRLARKVNIRADLSEQHLVGLER